MPDYVTVGRRIKSPRSCRAGLAQFLRLSPGTAGRVSRLVKKHGLQSSGLIGKCQAQVSLATFLDQSLFWATKRRRMACIDISWPLLVGQAQSIMSKGPLGCFALQLHLMAWTAVIVLSAALQTQCLVPAPDCSEATSVRQREGPVISCAATGWLTSAQV